MIPHLSTKGHLFDLLAIYKQYITLKDKLDLIFLQIQGLYYKIMVIVKCLARIFACKRHGDA